LVAVRAVRFSPGMQLYLDGVSVTKQKGFGKFNVACKWKRKYSGWTPDEGWFIMTNLPDLESAILSKKKDLALKKCSEILRVVVIS